jgi:hypothetical protein
MSTSTSTSEAASVRRCRTARWGATQRRLWIWPLLCNKKEPKSNWFVFRKWVVLSHFLSLTVTPNREQKSEIRKSEIQEIFDGNQESQEKKSILGIGPSGTPEI